MLIKLKFVLKTVTDYLAINLVRLL